MRSRNGKNLRPLLKLTMWDRVVAKLITDNHFIHGNQKESQRKEEKEKNIEAII